MEQPFFLNELYEQSSPSAAVPLAAGSLRRESYLKLCGSAPASRRDEKWQYTNLAPLLSGRYTRPQHQPPSTALVEEVSSACWDHDLNVVFVDGRFAPELSSPGALPRNGGVEIRALGDLSESQLIGWFDAPVAGGADGYFEHIGRAFLGDGLHIKVRQGHAAPQRIHIVHAVSSATARHHFVPITQLIELAPGSTLTLVESFIAENDAAYFSHLTTRIRLHENSKLDHARLHYPSRRGFHYNSYSAAVAENSTLHSYMVNLGGRIYRNEMQALLLGKGAAADLTGLMLVRPETHVDNQITMHHKTPEATSRQLFKTILLNQAKSAFAGEIRVDRLAQKTDAYQLSRALLLGEKAEFNAKPQLYIDANDVKCSHGSTTGRLQADEVFYLKSRGIAESDAKVMLCRAFAGETLTHLEDPKVKEVIHRKIEDIITA
jgi:Fe-S cluster assembly protein SufD